VGQAVAGHICRELATVIDGGGEGDVFDLSRASQERADRLDARERVLDDRAT
jgi:hypothetical protein